MPKQINYGFNPDKVIIKPQDCKFCSNLPLSVLNEDGQWDKWLAFYEPQAEKYETWGCVCWGTLNQLEILMKFLFSFEPNFSERYNYNLIGIEEGGTNPNDGCQSVKNDGAIDQHFLPVPDTFKEFRTPRPMTLKYTKEGVKFKEQYEYWHEWVIPSNPLKMKELIRDTLRYSPVALSVTAWNEQNGLYVSNGQNNHWCVCFGYRETEQGLVLRIFDSYDHSIKELHPDHFVAFAKRIYITKLTENVLHEAHKPKQRWWFVESFLQMWYFIKDIFSLKL